MDRAPHGNPDHALEPASRWDAIELSVKGFLLGYDGPTRSGYATQLRLWRQWLLDHDMDLFDARRVHVELYARELGEVHGRKASTINHKLSVMAAFYKWCVVENVAEHNPVAHARRPKVDTRRPRSYLDRAELTRFLDAARASDTRDAALCTLLGVNGLRISEALNANIEDLDSERGHRTLRVTRKGGKVDVVPLPPSVAVCIDVLIAGRLEGPIFLGREGDRMCREVSAAAVRRVARRAGITHPITPHSLRRSAITALLDAGVPIRDVQHFAAHSDPRTTSHYDQGRKSLDRNPVYALAAFVASG